MTESPPEITGAALSELLLDNMESFLQQLKSGRGSQGYRGAGCRLLREFASFCENEQMAPPWRLRQQYLEQRTVRRAQKRYSSGYLRAPRRYLALFLRWYLEKTELGELDFGVLPAKVLDRYWSTRDKRSAAGTKLLERHLPCLREFLPKAAAEGPAHSVDQLLSDYLEERHLARRGGGYSRQQEKLARGFTRRYLVWLEKAGHLPAGSARGATPLPPTRTDRSPEERLCFFSAKVDESLPPALRQPLLEYLGQLVFAREMSEGALYQRLPPNLTLCHRLAEDGLESFAGLRVRHLDEVVSSQCTAPLDDILRRRRQVQRLNSHLRDFLGYLYRRGELGRELSAALISPPCYRASAPPAVLSVKQVQRLLASVDRGEARGRRLYAILMLLTTYGLRPVDVARLTLDDLDWRNERLSFIQSKTGVAVSEPLLGEVAQALYTYLSRDRDRQVTERRIFLALYWPFQPLTRGSISGLVKEALRGAGLEGVSAKHLRGSLATQLLRQGEPLSVVQDVLGHRSAETSHGYTVIDPVLLREVIEEPE